MINLNGQPVVTASNNANFLSQARVFGDVDVTNQPELFMRTLNRFADDITNAVNTRTIGTYSQQPLPCGNQFFFTTSPSANDVQRVVVTTSTINNGVTMIAAPIVPADNLFITALYGMATDGVTSSLPLPYLDALVPTSSIGVYFDLTNANVVIETTTSAWVGFSAFLVVEYTYISSLDP
jgi:hypothetical protein